MSTRASGTGPGLTVGLINVVWVAHAREWTSLCLGCLTGSSRLALPDALADAHRHVAVSHRGVGVVIRVAYDAHAEGAPAADRRGADVLAGV